MHLTLKNKRMGQSFLHFNIIYSLILAANIAIYLSFKISSSYSPTFAMNVVDNITLNNLFVKH